jgi:hypothetical protein
MTCSSSVPPRGGGYGTRASLLVELEALELLTHAPGEPYEVYVRRIAEAPGPAGRIARIVKLADLDDHLAHATIPLDAPPYAWARNHLLASANGVTCRSRVG